MKKVNVFVKIEQWLWTIIGEEGKIEMARKDNKEVEKAIKVVDEMSMNKEIIEITGLTEEQMKELEKESL